MGIEEADVAFLTDLSGRVGLTPGGEAPDEGKDQDQAGDDQPGEPDQNLPWVACLAHWQPVVGEVAPSELSRNRPAAS